MTNLIQGRQTHWVHALGADEHFPFYAESAKQAAEYMVYYKCVSAYKPYEIVEMWFGYLICLDGKPLWLVGK